MLFPEPAPPPGDVERHYWRCRNCLTVFATDGPLLDPRPTCGGCGATRARYMGRVVRTRLVIDDFRTPCDGRCTGALGPTCDCQCRGANHGSGLVVKVELDGGGVPVAAVPIAADARARAVEWGVLLGRARAICQTLRGGTLAREIADGWLVKIKSMRSNRRLAEIDEFIRTKGGSER